MSYKRKTYETRENHYEIKNSRMKSKDANKELPNRVLKSNRILDHDQVINDCRHHSQAQQPVPYEKDDQSIKYKMKNDSLDFNGNTKSYDNNKSSQSRLTSFCKLLSVKTNTANKFCSDTSDNIAPLKEMKQSSEGNFIVDKFNRGIKPDIVSSR